MFNVQRAAVGLVQQQPPRVHAPQYTGRPTQLGQVPSDRHHLQFTRVLARVQLSVHGCHEPDRQVRHLVRTVTNSDITTPTDQL